MPGSLLSFSDNMDIIWIYCSKWKGVIWFTGIMKKASCIAVATSASSVSCLNVNETARVNFVILFLFAFFNIWTHVTHLHDVQCKFMQRTNCTHGSQLNWPMTQETYVIWVEVNLFFYSLFFNMSRLFYFETTIYVFSTRTRGKQNHFDAKRLYVMYSHNTNLKA